MQKYISILRGINVSGQKKIKMADLKSTYENLGFQNVVTYIQSGNVIFNAERQSRIELVSTIEALIEETYHFHVPVQIRTNSEFESIIQGCPFGAVDIDRDGTKVLVTFLSSAPEETAIAGIQEYVAAPEKLVIIGTEVYLYCPNGYGKSKLSNVFVEKKLGVEATTRNWKTVLKLYQLSTPQ